MTTMTVPDLESLSFKIEQEIRVRASLEVTFAALLDQLASGFEKDDGTSMPFKLEAWPGGRWFRDLGDGNGHCWATVQAIKRPTLIEFSGPLMMSFPVANNVQYRLSQQRRRQLIKFHQAPQVFAASASSASARCSASRRFCFSLSMSAGAHVDPPMRRDVSLSRCSNSLSSAATSACACFSASRKCTSSPSIRSG
jgi:hypothetical protein